MTSTSIKIGARLQLNAASGWRSLYPVYDYEALIGFLGMESGYSKPWRLYKLALKRFENQKNVEGCVPGERVALVAGKERALEYICEDNNRAKFNTRVEMMEAQVKVLTRYKQGCADTLASCITRHGERLQQREALAAVLDAPDYVVGGQRFTLLKLLGEIVADINARAEGIERQREDLERAEGQEQRAAEGFGVTLGDLQRPSIVPTGTQVEGAQS